MSHIKKNNPSFGASVEELILAVASKYNFPIIFNFPAGHDPENRALILGREVELEVTTTTSHIHFKN
jgi:muramoyltetrapeptide carboxypeptidase